jgi:hypothetical protein
MAVSSAKVASSHPSTVGASEVKNYIKLETERHLVAHHREYYRRTGFETIVLSFFQHDSTKNFFKRAFVTKWPTASFLKNLSNKKNYNKYLGIQIDSKLNFSTHAKELNLNLQKRVKVENTF